MMNRETKAKNVIIGRLAGLYNIEVTNATYKSWMNSYEEMCYTMNFELNDGRKMKANVVLVEKNIYTDDSHYECNAFDNFDEYTLTQSERISIIGSIKRELDIKTYNELNK